MSNKLKKQNRTKSGNNRQDSVFKEAWENMNHDMSRLLPNFMGRHLQKKEGKIWLMVVITLVELIVLGVIGKMIYDWFAG
jgi:hypothetical protein